MTRTIIAALAAVLAVGALADTSFVAGIGGGNGQCGRFEAEGFAEADFDSADRPAHFILRVGPNGSCTGQGVAVDGQVAQRFGDGAFYGVVTAGYDQDTVPYEYGPCIDGFKCFHSVGVSTTTLSFGGGARLGDWSEEGTGWRLSAEIAANAVDNPLATGENLSPLILSLSARAAGVEIDATVHDEGIADVRVKRAVGRMQVGVSVSANGHKLDNPAPATLSGQARLGGPNPVYSVDVGWRF